MANGSALSASVMPQAPSPMTTPAGQSSAMGQPQGAPGGDQGQQQPPPPPTHAQTVAALRHFDALRKELTGLLKLPETGRTSVKSQIIDGMTGLVASRIVPAGDAVQQLGTVPERAFDQRKWLEQHLMAVDQASVSILQHHRVGFGGQEDAGPAYDPDNHLDTMAGLMQGYKGGGG